MDKMILFPLLAALFAVTSGLNGGGTLELAPGVHATGTVNTDNGVPELEGRIDGPDGLQAEGTMDDKLATGSVKNAPGIGDQSGSVPVEQVMSPLSSLKVLKRSVDSDSDSVSSSEENADVPPVSVQVVKRAADEDSVSSSEENADVPGATGELLSPGVPVEVKKRSADDGEEVGASKNGKRKDKGKQNGGKGKEKGGKGKGKGKKV